MEYFENADLIATLVFWISKPKSNIGQIWAEKVEVVSFAWKLTYSISRMLNTILMLVFSNLEYADSYSGISFMKFQT